MHTPCDFGARCVHVARLLARAPGPLAKWPIGAARGLGTNVGLSTTVGLVQRATHLAEQAQGLPVRSLNTKVTGV